MQNETINYDWDETEQALDDLYESISVETQPKNSKALPTRHNLQITRRLFHMANGFVFATLYLISLSHSQMIHLLGTLACLLYLVEQIRINYPDTAAKLLPFTKLIMRAEEQLKESAMVPYAMAILLTIITFPKHIALVGIYTLAFADPLSAIIGIKFGKHKISPTRSLEGSSAFFVSTFLACLFVLAGYNSSIDLSVVLISLLLGLMGAVFDLFPLKLDDNLTIPLFTSFALWLICTIFGVYL